MPKTDDKRPDRFAADLVFPNPPKKIGRYYELVVVFKGRKIIAMLEENQKDLLVQLLLQGEMKDDGKVL